jgi:hypothetical protein
MRDRPPRYEYRKVHHVTVNIVHLWTKDVKEAEQGNNGEPTGRTDLHCIQEMRTNGGDSCVEIGLFEEQHYHVFRHISISCLKYPLLLDRYFIDCRAFFPCKTSDTPEVSECLEHTRIIPQSPDH